MEDARPTPAKVVVAVSNQSACKDAIKWAVANKIRGPEDTLVFLHVVSRIPSPMGMEMYQSEVNNTMFVHYVRMTVQPLMLQLKKLVGTEIALVSVGLELQESEVNNTILVHYVRTIVQPMMLQLKKYVSSEVKLELKVGRNNSKEKGIIEETKKLKATALVIGSNSRTMFGMSQNKKSGRQQAASTGAYCIKTKPLGMAVFVIQKDKVVMVGDENQTGSPESSPSSSPSHSGRLSGIASPMVVRKSNSFSVGTAGSIYKEARSDLSPGQHSGDLPESSGRHSSGKLPVSAPGSEPLQPNETRAFSTPFPHVIAASPPPSIIKTPPVSSSSGSSLRNWSARLSASRTARHATLQSSSGEGNVSGGLPPVSGKSNSGTHLPSTGENGRPKSNEWSGNLRSGQLLTTHSGGQSSSTSMEHESVYDEMVKGQQQEVGDMGSWSAKIKDEHQKHQFQYTADLEGRLSQARAALANFSVGGVSASGTLTEEDDKTSESEVAGESGSGSQAPEGPLPPAVENPVLAQFVASSGASRVENALLKELAMMRLKATQAEKARVEAEHLAAAMLSAADVSLREVEAQSKKREQENKVLIEKATQEASRAMAWAEEARRKAVSEAQKTEQAISQAAVTSKALEHESRKRQDAEEKARQDAAARRQLKNYRQYTWAELELATESFSITKKIGEGGFGTVYSGILHHTAVAVKILKNADALQAANEFQQEVEVLGQIQHPHMVMLLGCCPEKYALVYEYMANGSLEDRLMCTKGTPPLPWFIRLRIAAEAASALLILHNRPVPIVHRDLKPANILLDRNFVAKLGDVGLARLMPDLNDNQTYMRESVPVGTFAYVDPEFQRTGEFGPKSDVYALGIVLLDLLTGRKPNVYEHLEDAVEEGDREKLRGFLDMSAGQWPIEVAMDVAQVAVKCSEMRRKKRPDLDTEVMPSLEKIRAIAAAAEEDSQTRRNRSRLGEAPSSLFCPITQEMMVNPVLASDGHTYELVAIQQWLETNDRSPLTNVKLPNKDLVPNHALKMMIREWSERNAS